MVKLAMLVLVVQTAVARADKIDDTYEATDNAWKRYTAAQQKAQAIADKYKSIWAPVYEQKPLRDSTYAAAQQACAGAGHGTKPCTDATLAYAAAQKEFNFRSNAAEADDPKHEYAGPVLDRANADAKRLETDFETTRETYYKTVIDARAHAKTKADRDRIDQRLAEKEAKRLGKARDNTSGKADAQNPSTGNNPNGGGHCVGCGFTVPSDPWHGSR